MYKANLSYEQIHYYLNDLLSTGLIVQDISDGSIVYRTTEKGREYLRYYYHLIELVREEDRHIREEDISIVT
jgi:predicted transcriptional regulator